MNNSIKNLSNIKQYKAEAILLFTAFTWGFSFPSVKISLEYVSPNAFIFFRFLITLALFLIFFFNKVRQFKFKKLIYGYILGIFLFIGFITQTIGLKHTSASNSAFITGTNLILIPFVQILIIKKYPKIENIIGIIIVFIGLYFLANIGTTGINYGDFITLFCAVSFAFHIVLLDKFSRFCDTNVLIFGQYISMTILSLISMIFLEILTFNEFKFIPTTFTFFAILFNAVFSTFLALYLAMSYQKYTTPVRAGLIYNMEQLFAVFFAYILINEIMTSRQVIGAVIMISGLFFSEFYPFFKSKLKNEIFKN